MKKLFLSFIALIMLLSFSSCSKKATDLIIGHWKITLVEGSILNDFQKFAIWEFESNGTMRFEYDGNVYQGSYNVDGPNIYLRYNNHQVNGKIVNMGDNWMEWQVDDNNIFFDRTGESVSDNPGGGGNGIIEGALNGLFTINSHGDKVYFSKGNLQYQASTNTWRFAEHQWNFVGGICDSGDEFGNVYENGVKCDNAHVTSNYEGWFDLFGWGTSGYNHGAVCYQPWSTSDNNSNYYAFGSPSNNLSGQADWGYNAISNGGNQNGLWRTLSKQEWEYVIAERDTPSGVLFAKAEVNDVYGIIILPDDWNNSYYEVNNPNNGNASFTGNEISASTWSVLESYGALFLPKTGIRIEGGYYGYGGCNGDYWSSTIIDDDDASRLMFDYNYVGTGIWPQRRFNGRCVRLVHDAE